MRSLLFIFELFWIAFPVLLFQLGFPLVPEHKTASAAIFGIGAVYLICIGMLSGAKISRWSSYGRFQNVVNLYYPLTVLAISLLLILTGSNFPLLAALALFVLTGAVLAHVFCAGSRVRDTGLVSLLCFLAFIVNGELLLRSFPQNILVREVRHVPELAPADKGEIFFRTHGFRDRRPSKEHANDVVRIVTMGGSSTYGIPMHTNAYTYSAELQRLLSARRPNEHYEVLNAGVAGYGIVQVVEAIKKEVLKFHPNIVVICSWFNDSAPVPGWYGMGNLSDRDAENRVRVLRKIEASLPYKKISTSRIYGLMRYYLVNLRDRVQQMFLTKNTKVNKKRRKRMSPTEFALELERIVELGKKNDFVPIFVYEPINRSFSLDEGLRRNKYYREIKKVADQNGVLVVDTLTDFHARRDEWLFYDFIHPNPEGHKITAEAIYRALFALPQNRWLKNAIKLADK